MAKQLVKHYQTADGLQFNVDGEGELFNIFTAYTMDNTRHKMDEISKAAGCSVGGISYV